MKRRPMLTMPRTSNRDRVLKFCDWVESLPMRVVDYSVHPEHRARSARLSLADWKAVDHELARRRDALVDLSTLSPETRAAAARLAEWITRHRDASPLAEEEFSGMSRFDLRVAITIVAKVAGELASTVQKRAASDA